MLCVASIHVWFKSRTDEHAVYSHPGTYALRVRIGHYAPEATKNICWAKGEGVFDHCTVTRWWKKFRSSYKKLDDQAKWGRPKPVDSEAVHRAIEAKWASISESSRPAWYLTVQCGLSTSRRWHKRLELPNCASRYKNI